MCRFLSEQLLGIDCHDLDIAIDKMMGQSFAERLTVYLKARGVSATSCGIIHSNPERSKHLETATLAINGQLIDFVNLRAETYATNSRIPNSIAFGTPIEDALRRDITINSMFWNIHTEEVEDFTGHGLSDLAHGIIRTPLAPKETLLDDPLRLLRVIRFSTRFQFTIVPELLEAMRDPIAHQSLRDKVSRERVGIEVDKILGDRHAIQGLFLINDIGVFDLIFGSLDAELSRKPSLPQQSIYALLMTLSKVIYFQPEWTAEQLRLALLAGSLIPYAGAKFQLKRTSQQLQSQQPGIQAKEEFVTTCIVRDSLKYSNREIVQVGALLNHLDRAGELIYRGSEWSDAEAAIAIGRLLKDLGSEWRLALHLAVCWRFWESQQLARENGNERHSEDELRTGHLAPLHAFLARVTELGLADAWKWKPLLSGSKLQGLLNVKPGLGIGQQLAKLLDWQYQNPLASPEDAERFLLRQ
jgi:tRNA nucleotidyltransferase (CCA-adding enzyme)